MAPSTLKKARGAMRRQRTPSTDSPVRGVQMAPSTLTDGRSVGSTVAFDDDNEDDDDDDGGTFVSITSNDYTHQDGASAVDNKGTGTGIRSDLGLGGITSFGGGEASTGSALTPAHVRPAATSTANTTTVENVNSSFHIFASDTHNFSFLHENFRFFIANTFYSWDNISIQL